MQNGATNSTKVGLSASTFWINLYIYLLYVNAVKTNVKHIYEVALVVHILNVNYIAGMVYGT